ncbi:MAG: hypothetical protein PF689_04985 [Deltaproteobacteria bacterium]|nr:hypothetical protein [Deltaproteobacteria bacterium]
MSDLLLGSLIALGAYTSIVFIVLYNRKIIETICDKELTQMRAIKSELKMKKCDSEAKQAKKL